MSACGVTRLLIPGFLAGLAVATFLGNDLYGWIAAGVTVAVVAAVLKVRGNGQACAIPTQGPVRGRADVELDTPTSDRSSR